MVPDFMSSGHWPLKQEDQVLEFFKETLLDSITVEF